MNNIPLRLPSMPDRALLINSPAYDIRLPWAKWLQPTHLLRLITYFRRSGVDVKYIDSLYTTSDERLRRKRVDILDLDGQKVPKWRYGLPENAFTNQLKALAKANWQPDDVYVECFTTFWWEGAEEIIRSVKKIFPSSHVVLIGAYASLAPEHAKTNTLADEVLTQPWDGIECLPADLSLYPKLPAFLYVTLGKGKRTPDEIIDEIREAAKQGINQFVFAEDMVAHQYTKLYTSVLEKVASSKPKVKLYALGNIYPADIVEQTGLARLMKAAGYAQIWFADDRQSPIAHVVDEQLIETYQKAAQLCHNAGFQKRADAIIAAVCLGRKSEDLAERAALATLAAHHLGSVIFWAYQPALSECVDIPLQHQNGKMFPLRQKNDKTYRDYLDVLGLASVLNSKYREYTFDFMGDGLVANLFRQSMERRAWEPEPEIKGSLLLPMKAKR